MCDNMATHFIGSLKQYYIPSNIPSGLSYLVDGIIAAQVS